MSAVTPAVSGLRRSAVDTLRLYYEMTRPRVLALVLFTGLPALALGQSAWPGMAVATWVLVGTALSGASCSVLNAWIERTDFGELKEALDAVGVRADLFTADDAGHGFFNRTPWFQPTLERLEAFLRDVFA